MNLLNNAVSESNPKSKPTPLSEKEAQRHRATQETCIIRIMLKFPAFQVHWLFEKHWKARCLQFTTRLAMVVVWWSSWDTCETSPPHLDSTLAIGSRLETSTDPDLPICTFSDGWLPAVSPALAAWRLCHWPTESRFKIPAPTLSTCFRRLGPVALCEKILHPQPPLVGIGLIPHQKALKRSLQVAPWVAMLASRNSILFRVKVFDCLLKTEEKRLAVDSHDSGVDDEQRYGLHILVTLVIAKSLKIDPTWNPLTHFT